MMTSRAEDIEEHTANGRMLAFVTAYFLITSLTIYTTRFSGGLALVWLGTAILVGLLTHVSYAMWPRTIAAFVLASACATTLFGFGPGPAIPLALINVGEGALIAFLLRHFRPQRDYLENGRAFAWLAICTVAIGPVCAGVFGAVVVALFAHGNWADSLGNWVAGHGLGTLMVAPLALMSARGSLVRLARGADPQGYRDLAFLALTTTAVTALALYWTGHPMLFITVVPLLAGCFLLGWIGAITALLCIALTAAASLAVGVGVIAAVPGGLAGQVLFLQFYLAVMMMIALPTATVLARNRLLLMKITKRDAMHQLISDHSDDAMLTVDAAGAIRYASAAAYEISGEQELIGRRLADLAMVEDSAKLRRSFVRAARDPGQTQIREYCIGADDDLTCIEIKVRAFNAGSGKLGGFVVTARDVTRRMERDMMIAEVEHTDPLTGLPNRRKFFKRLKDQLAVADEQPFALAVFDLDRFVEVNRRFGREVGDLVLRHVGKSMRRVSGEELFFARIAGEEFGLIATGDDPARALAVCRALVSELETRPAWGAGRLSAPVSMSVGLTRFDRAVALPDAMRAADNALVAAKAAGQHAVRYAA